MGFLAFLLSLDRENRNKKVPKTHTDAPFETSHNDQPDAMKRADMVIARHNYMTSDCVCDDADCPYCDDDDDYWNDYDDN